VTQTEPVKAAVYHVINPNTSSSWNVVLAGLKNAGLRFDTISPEEWLDRLARSDSDGARNPTIKLLVSGLFDVLSLFALILYPYLARVSIATALERPINAQA
jgi:hypothetical protein